MARRNGPTVHDVAARAGVSIATVSRVLNASRPVAPDIARRVAAAAEELGYTANLLGRALRMGRSHSVGLVVPDLANPFFATLAQRISLAFRAVGIDVFVYDAENDLEAERRGIASFLGRQVDGLVLVPCDEVRSAPSVALAAAAALTIQVDRRAPAVDTHYVGVDNRAGMRLVAEHVRATASRRASVVFVGARPVSSSARERLDTFTEAFPGATCVLGSFTFDFGLRAMDGLITDGLRRGTVVTDADVIALGVLAAIQGRGGEVPAHFRVTGFDDVGVAAFAHPTLTTVRQPLAEMTAVLVELVRGALGGSGEPGPVVRYLAPELVVRASSPA